MNNKRGIIGLILMLGLHFAHAQVPAIASVTPASGPVGTSVTIGGTNFSNNPTDNVVHFGAIKGIVTSSTPTSILATVPMGASYESITVTVNGLVTSSVPFLVTFNSNKVIDATSFENKIDITTGLNPFGVALADFDNDGKTDLITSNTQSASLSVLRNTSTSGILAANSLSPKVDLNTGFGPYALAIGDMDGDGKKDIVTIYNGTTISVYKNMSSTGSLSASSFAPPVDFLVGYSIALGPGLAIADLDNDGKQDLAVTEQTGNKVMVFRNTGNTGVVDANLLAAKVEFGTAALPMKVAIADLDGDGKKELAVANTNGNSVSVFKNNCTSGVINANSFAPRVDIVTGPNGTTDVAIGDLDGDNKPDLAVANYYSNTLSVLKNTTIKGSITNESFATKVDFPTGTGPQTLALSDLDGDGKLDIAVANFSANVTDATANKVSIFKNTTSNNTLNANSFAPKVDFGVGTNPVTVVIGDIDRDGGPDLIVTNQNSNSVSLLRNKNFRSNSQTMTIFESISDKKMGDPPFTLSASASSGLAAQFMTLSDKISISGTQATILKPGKVTIVAHQPGNDSYSAAVGLEQTFCINPAKPIITANLSDPSQAILTSSSDTGNLWIRNGTLVPAATGKTFTVKESGIYAVKINIDGCVSPTSEEVNLVVTGDLINGLQVASSVYPNPVQHQLSVLMDGFANNEAVLVNLVDGAGNIISKQSGIGGTTVQIDVTHHATGVYYVLMTQGRTIKQVRFVKK